MSYECKKLEHTGFKGEPWSGYCETHKCSYVVCYLKEKIDANHDRYCETCNIIDGALCRERHGQNRIFKEMMKDSS